MKISRRDLVKGASVAAMVVSSPRLAEAWIPHGVGYLFNNGKAQLNLDSLQVTGIFPFINYVKNAGNWGSVAAGFAVTPDYFDSDGWPTSLPVGRTTVLFYIPSQLEYATDWVLAWDGGGGTASVLLQIGSGGFSSDGGATYVQTANFSSSPVQIKVSGTADNRVILGFDAVGSPHVTNLRFYPKAEEAAFNRGEVYSAKFKAKIREGGFEVLRFVNWQWSGGGGWSNAVDWASANKPETYYQFNADQYVTSRLCNLAGHGLTTNSGIDYSVSAPTTWATSGGLPADKSLVHVAWNVAATGSNGFVTFTGGGSPNVVYTPITDTVVSGTYNSLTGLVTLTLNSSHPNIPAGQAIALSGMTGTGSFATLNGTFNLSAATVNSSIITFFVASGLTMTIGSGGSFTTSHGLVAGNQVYFTLQSSGTQPSEITMSTLSGGTFIPLNIYWVKSVVDATTVTLAATNGGATINIASSGFTATFFGRPNPTLNVGGTGAISVYGDATNINLLSAQIPTALTIATAFYDAKINAWLIHGGTFSAGIDNGIPVSLCLRLCKEVGSHPWFTAPPYSCTPMSDYAFQLATYLKANSLSWMVPRYEGPNETWGAQVCVPYAAFQSYYQWGASDIGNWYGKAMSTIGQDFDKVYSANPNLGTKYHIVCGLQMAGDGSTSWNTHFTSAKYVLDTPQSGYTATPAYTWTSHACVATYMRPSVWNNPVASISSGTYNSGTGQVVLTLSSSSVPPYFVVGQSITLSGMGGTGSVASLNGTWPTVATTSGSTVTFTAPTGLTLTITGGSFQSNEENTLADVSHFAGMQINGYITNGVLTVSAINSYNYITSGTYNSTTGVTVMTLASNTPATFTVGQSISVFKMTGTGSFASLNGTYTVTSVGSGGSTVTFTAATGLTLTIGAGSRLAPNVIGSGMTILGYGIPAGTQLTSGSAGGAGTYTLSAGTLTVGSSSVTGNFVLGYMAHAAKYADYLNAGIGQTIPQLHAYTVDWNTYFQTSPAYTNTIGHKMVLCAYEGGYDAIFNGGGTSSQDLLRYGAKFVLPSDGGTGTGAQAYYALLWSNFIADGGTVPSQYLLGSSLISSWGLLDSVYQPIDPPMWKAIRAFSGT